MCLHGHRYFECGHSVDISELCERAGDNPYWVMVGCPDYEHQDERPDYSCGLGAYYCSEVPVEGPWLDEAFRTIYRTNACLIAAAQDAKAMILEARAFLQAADANGVPHAVRKQLPEYRRIQLEWRQAQHEHGLAKIKQMQMWSIIKEGEAHFEQRRQLRLSGVDVSNYPPFVPPLPLNMELPLELQTPVPSRALAGPVQHYPGNIPMAGQMVDFVLNEQAARASGQNQQAARTPGQTQQAARTPGQNQQAARPPSQQRPQQHPSSEGSNIEVTHVPRRRFYGTPPTDAEIQKKFEEAKARHQKRGRPAAKKASVNSKASAKQSPSPDPEGPRRSTRARNRNINYAESESPQSSPLKADSSSFTSQPDRQRSQDGLAEDATIMRQNSSASLSNMIGNWKRLNPGSEEPSTSSSMAISRREQSTSSRLQHNPAPGSTLQPNTPLSTAAGASVTPSNIPSIFVSPAPGGDAVASTTHKTPSRHSASAPSAGRSMLPPLPNASMINRFRTPPQPGIGLRMQQQAFDTPPAAGMQEVADPSGNAGPNAGRKPAPFYAYQQPSADSTLHGTSRDTSKQSYGSLFQQDATTSGGQPAQQIDNSQYLGVPKQQKGRMAALYGDKREYTPLSFSSTFPAPPNTAPNRNNNNSSSVGQSSMTSSSSSEVAGSREIIRKVLLGELPWEDLPRDRMGDMVRGMMNGDMGGGTGSRLGSMSGSMSGGLAGNTAGGMMPNTAAGGFSMFDSGSPITGYGYGGMQKSFQSGYDLSPSAPSTFTTPVRTEPRKRPAPASSPLWPTKTPRLSLPGDDNEPASHLGLAHGHGFPGNANLSRQVMSSPLVSTSATARFGQWPASAPTMVPQGIMYPQQPSTDGMEDPLYSDPVTPNNQTTAAAAADDDELFDFGFATTNTPVTANAAVGNPFVTADAGTAVSTALGDQIISEQAGAQEQPYSTLPADTPQERSTNADDVPADISWMLNKNMLDEN